MAAPPAPAGYPPGTALPKRKTSPIVWVLVIILGLFILGGIAIVGTGFFVVHKARQAGLDPDLIRRNPGLAIGKMVAAANPDVDVVSSDDAAGTITFRDRKTGKTVTVTFDQARNGQVRFKAQDEDGKTATMEIGGPATKLPSWVPSYPGQHSEGTFAIRGDAGDGSGEGGNFTFTTTDTPSKVMSFYQQKAKDLGMTVNLNGVGDSGGIIVANDDPGRRSLTIVVGGSGSDTTVNLTYSSKK